MFLEECEATLQTFPVLCVKQIYAAVMSFLFSVMYGFRTSQGCWSRIFHMLNFMGTSKLETISLSEYESINEFCVNVGLSTCFEWDEVLSSFSKVFKVFARTCSCLWRTCWVLLQNSINLWRPSAVPAVTRSHMFASVCLGPCKSHIKKDLWCCLAVTIVSIQNTC